jgi:hypothetical protein
MPEESIAPLQPCHRILAGGVSIPHCSAEATLGGAAESRAFAFDAFAAVEIRGEHEPKQ